jgi:DHA1 family tetracycline resistance protein-like MFS transporter
MSHATHAAGDPSPLPLAPGGRSARRALAVIFLIVFVDLMGFGIIIPLLQFYVPDFQSRPLAVTLLFSTYSICQFLGAPVLGALSDRFGRRPVLIISQLGSAAGYVILGLSTQLPLHPAVTLVLVYLSRIIDGASGGNISTAQAYISDVTTPANRARGMGVIGIALGLGFAAGPWLGGVVGRFDVSYPAFAAAAFSLAAAILTFAWLPESNRHKPSGAMLLFHPSVFMPVFRSPVAAQLILITAVSMSAFVMLETTVGMYLHAHFGFEQLQIGYFFGMVGIVIVIVQGGLVGRLTRRLGEWPLAVAGPALVALAMTGFITAGYLPLLALVIASGICNATGRSLQQPTVSSLISQHTPRDQQGVAFGLYHALASLARVLGPVVSGLAYPHLRNTAQFAVAAALLAVAALWTLRVHAAANAAAPAGA